MFFKKSTAAEAVLQQRAKIVGAIQAEEARLPGLIAARVQAERDLANAEAAEALGETVDTTAHLRPDVAKAAIEKTAAKLAALRGRLASMAGELASARAAVKGDLPAHVEKLKAEFTSEWLKGAAAFAELQGKRAAIEARIGKLNLSAPSPAAVELSPAIVQPWLAIEALEAAISEVDGWNQSAIWPDLDARSPNARVYDPGAVYAVTSEHAGLPVGSLVVDCSLVPGAVNHLYQIGYLALAKEQQWREALASSSQAALGVRNDARIAEQAAEVARNVTAPIIASAPETRPAKSIHTGEQPVTYGKPIEPRQNAPQPAPRRLHEGKINH